MKRSLTFLLFFISLSSAYAANLWTDRGSYSISWYSSTKMEFDISSAEEFAGIAVLINEGYTDFSKKTINIKKNIDLNGKQWIPIGNKSNPFKGILNGHGYEISGIEIAFHEELQYSEYIGLFGATNNATLKDLSISGNLNISIDNYYPVQYIGSYCGYATNTSFENLISTISLNYYRATTSSHKYDICIGGFLGYINNCNLKNVHFKGDYSVYIGPSLSYGSFLEGSDFRFGGLFASGEYSTIKYSSVKSNIKIDLGSSQNITSNPSLVFGGISAYPSCCDIEGCYSVLKKVNLLPPYSSSRKGSVTFGGICGYPPTSYASDRKGKIINCYAAVIDSQTTIATGYINYGGIIGFDYNATANIPQRYNYNYSNKDFILRNSIENISLAYTQKGFNGDDSFNLSEMLSKPFVDDLNLYYTLNGEEPLWSYIENNFPTIYETPQLKVDEIETSQSYSIQISKGELTIIDNNSIEEFCCLHDMNGQLIYRGSNHIISNLRSGVYVLKYKSMTRKILIP